MLARSDNAGGEPAGDADAAIRELYARHAQALATAGRTSQPPPPESRRP